MAPDTTPSSAVHPSAPGGGGTSVDRLSALLERFRVRAHLFHAGPLCGVTHFAAQPGRAFLHVLRRGDMWVTHQPASGAPRKLRLTQPTLLFYPRPLAHDFHNAPMDGSDFVCATLDFDGGPRHPLVQALPSVLALPVAQVAGIEQTLQLLFAETERVRCGQRLLADRLFEVLLLQMLRWLLDHPAEGSAQQAGVLAGLAHPSWRARSPPCTSSPAPPGRWTPWPARPACRAAPSRPSSRPWWARRLATTCCAGAWRWPSRSCAVARPSRLSATRWATPARPPSAAPSRRWRAHRRVVG